jgi:hypothetical protein
MNTITCREQAGNLAIVKLMNQTKVAVEIPIGQERPGGVDTGGSYFLVGEGSQLQ